MLPELKRCKKKHVYNMTTKKESNVKPTGAPIEETGGSNTRFNIADKWNRKEENRSDHLDQNHFKLRHRL